MFYLFKSLISTDMTYIILASMCRSEFNLYVYYFGIFKNMFFIEKINMIKMEFSSPGNMSSSVVMCSYRHNKVDYRPPARNGCAYAHSNKSAF